MGGTGDRVKLIVLHGRQISALHGLDHIQHIGKQQVIEDSLQCNNHLDTETREYALVTLNGEIL